VLVLANVYFGFDTELTIGTTEQAVKLLLPDINPGVNQ